MIRTVFLLGILTGCSSARSAADVTRDVARGAVLVVVEAAEVGDEVCAGVAAQAKGGDEAALRRGIEIAHTCEKAKEVAITSARAMRMALNAWESGAAGKLACAGAQALGALNMTRDAIVRGDGDIPPVLDDGIAQAATLARMLPVGAICELSKGAK